MEKDQEKEYFERLKSVEDKVVTIDKKVDGVIISTNKEIEKSNHMFAFFQQMIDTLNNTQTQIARDMKDIKDVMIDFVELSTANSKDIESLREKHNREIDDLKSHGDKVEDLFNEMEQQSQESLKEKWKFFGIVVGAIVTIITGIFNLF